MVEKTFTVRRTMNQVFNKSLRLYRTARLPDGQGGHSLSEALVMSGPGRARPLSAREAVYGGYALGTNVLRFYTEADFDARVGDIIRCTDDEKVYRVTSVRNPSLASHHLEVETVEVS